MAYSYVNSSTTSNSTSTTSLTTASYTAGTISNLLVVTWIYFHSSNATGVTITDTQSNTWNSLVSLDNSGSFGGIRAWWAQAKNTSAFTVNVKTNNTLADPNIGLIEYTGLLTTSSVFVSGEVTVTDQSNTSLSSWSTGNTPTLSSNPCLILGVSYDTNGTAGVAVNAGSGYTSRQVLNIGTGGHGRIEDQRVTSNTAVAANFTAASGSAFPVSWVAAFHEQSTPPPNINPLLMHRRNVLYPI